MSDDTKEGVDDLYRQRLRTLVTVDDMIEEIVMKLEVGVIVDAVQFGMVIYNQCRRS